jgi:membrane-bound metal-dependent hydrolase YbcI (DUF457 family)
MTPLGHVSVSVVTGQSFKRLCLPALMVGGVLPDIDFIFILTDFFNQVHRVITHNLFFIVLASLVSMIIVSGERKRAVGISMLIGGALHLFIDACMDNNPSNGIGIAMFWPLSEDFYSPFNLLPLTADSHGWNEPMKMFKSILPNMLYEVPFYVMAVFHILRKRAGTN